VVGALGRVFWLLMSGAAATLAVCTIELALLLTIPGGPAPFGLALVSQTLQIVEPLYLATPELLVGAIAGAVAGTLANQARWSARVGAATVLLAYSATLCVLLKLEAPFAAMLAVFHLVVACVIAGIAIDLTPRARTRLTVDADSHGHIPRKKPQLAQPSR
jgi:hypothetical protein